MGVALIATLTGSSGFSHERARQPVARSNHLAFVPTPLFTTATAAAASLR